jgi:hypothetical protein
VETMNENRARLCSSPEWMGVDTNLGDRAEVTQC